MKINSKNTAKALAAVLGLSAVMTAPGEVMAANNGFAEKVQSRAEAAAKEAGADTGCIYVAKVNEYLSVFEEESIQSDLVGRLYRGAAAYVVKTDGDWSYINSGSVSGWVCNYFLVSGDEADELLEVINPRLASTTAIVLNVRKEADITSEVIAQVEEGSELVVTGSTEEWWRVRLTNDTVGYISKDYADVETGLYTAVTASAEKAMKTTLLEWAPVPVAQEKEEKEATYAPEIKSEKKTEAKYEADDEEEEYEEEEEEYEAEEEEEEETEAEEEYEEEEEEDDSESGWVSLGEFKTTAYCTGSCCNGSNAGKTATGATPEVGTTVAVDRNVIPLGSKIKIGDHVYIAQDTGVRGKTVDILMSSHGTCNDYGVRYREVYIYKG